MSPHSLSVLCFTSQHVAYIGKIKYIFPSVSPLGCAAQPLRPQAPVWAAQACGWSAAFSAGQPLAWLGAVLGGRGASRARSRPRRRAPARDTRSPASDGARSRSSLDARRSAHCRPCWERARSSSAARSPARPRCDHAPSRRAADAVRAFARLPAICSPADARRPLHSPALLARYEAAPGQLNEPRTPCPRAKAHGPPPLLQHRAQP